MTHRSLLLDGPICLDTYFNRVCTSADVFDRCLSYENSLYDYFGSAADRYDYYHGDTSAIAGWRGEG